MARRSDHYAQVSRDRFWCVRRGLSRTVSCEVYVLSTRRAASASNVLSPCHKRVLEHC